MLFLIIVGVIVVYRTVPCSGYWDGCDYVIVGSVGWHCGIPTSIVRRACGKYLLKVG